MENNHKGIDALSEEFLGMDVEALKAKGQQNHAAYTQASPFPNTCFDDFFSQPALEKILEEFPDLEEAKGTTKFQNKEEVKLASKGVYQFGPQTLKLVTLLNSEPFLQFLSELTGIQNLIADPYFEGGGYHQIKRGGFLKIHADFNKASITGLDRRLNILLYLNKDWQEDYGGHVEFWDKPMENCVQRFLPIFNRVVIFSTTSDSWHGHPDPITCPDDRSRKSLALYYYTNGRPEEEIPSGTKSHSTLFQARPDTDEGVGSHSSVSGRTKVKNLLKEVTPPILLKMLRG